MAGGDLSGMAVLEAPTPVVERQAVPAHNA